MRRLADWGIHRQGLSDRSAAISHRLRQSSSSWSQQECCAPSCALTPLLIARTNWYELFSWAAGMDYFIRCDMPEFLAKAICHFKWAEKWNFTLSCRNNLQKTTRKICWSSRIWVAIKMMHVYLKISIWNFLADGSFMFKEIMGRGKRHCSELSADWQRQLSEKYFGMDLVSSKFGKNTTRRLSIWDINPP